MRRFIVIGFTTNSTKELGQILHFGGNYVEAKDLCKDPSGLFARKELHELGVADTQRGFDPAASLAIA